MFKTGDYVEIHKSDWKFLTSTGVRNVEARGIKHIRGYILDEVEDDYVFTSGDNVLVRIDDGIALGFGHGGPVNGINIVSVSMLNLVAPRINNRENIYD